MLPGTPVVLGAKAVVRLSRRPYGWGSLALIYGYLSARLHRMPQVDDPRVISYLRQQQLARLFGGETIWK